MTTSPLIFDAWPADDPNGTALGELTAASDKEYRHVHQGIGLGSFTVNRHHAQAAWAATGNLVRVRRVAGGPFAYDSANYIGAFWVEQGDDILLDPRETGAEDLTRGGRTAEACLHGARLYPDAFDSRNDKFTTKTRIDGNWHIDDRTAGEVLAIFLRDLDDRTPDPLPFVTKDFGVLQDSTDTDWTDTGTNWQIPVGTSGLELLETCVSGGLYYRVSPAFLFSAYEAEPGADLTASITFAKGVNIEASAERQVYAPTTFGRVLMQGTKESGKLKYREVVDTTTEADLPRRIEGFAEFKRTPTNAKLDKAGLRAIRKSKRRYDGIPTFTVTEVEGQEAMLDYVPGDAVTVDIPGVYDEVSRRIYAVTLTEDEAGDVIATLEFEASPFSPGTNRSGEFQDAPGAGGGGDVNCGDCPPIPPYVPTPIEGESTPTDGGLLRVCDNNLALDGYSEPVDWQDHSAPLDTDAFAFHLTSGYYDGYTVVAASGTLDLAAYVTAIWAHTGHPDITMTVAIQKNGVTVASDSTFYPATGSFGNVVSAFTVTANDVAVVAGDVLTCLYTSTVNMSATIPSGTGVGTYFQILATSTVTLSAVTPGPLEGQSHVEEFAGDGSTTAFQTNYPYAENSLAVTVDGLLTPVTQTTPTTGTFTFADAPADGAVIIVYYQNAGTTGTGATNAVPVASTPSPPEPTADAHIADTSDAHDASAISFDPTGLSTVTGTDVQTAIEELDTASSSALTNPMTTAADLIVGDTGGTPARLAKGTDGQVLTVDPTTHLIVWANSASGFSDPMTTRGDIIVRASGGTDRLALGTSGYVLTSDGTDVGWAAASGGGGVDWNLDVNEDGSSFANFAAASGTWSSTGTVIQQTSSATGKRRTKYNPLVPLGFPFIMQVETQITTAGSPSIRSGLMLSDGTNDQGLIFYVDDTANAVICDKDSSVQLATASMTVVASTWYTLRVVSGSGGWISVYVDGTHMMDVPMLYTTYRAGSKWPGLYCENAAVEFRNFKIWTLSTGAPA